ncbi:MAG TPA: phosphoglycerate dehydrogenase [Nitrospiria bacterium]|nr:phosphoglycerate dehydrogenase [Nitrospiria bacterium]
MKVLVSDKLSDQGVKILKDAGLTVEVNTKLSPQELIQVIPNYDGLVVRSGTKVTKEVLAAATKLKVVGRAGSGLDNVDVEEATRRGVVVMNTPGGNTITTAEHSVALMLSMVRMIPQATASTKAGKWEKSRFTGIELYNKVIGVIGMGQIGGHVARLAQGLLMRVIAYDPYLSPETAKKAGVEKVELEELFRRSDIITVHVPLTPETTKLINADSFKLMKDGVRIVNCARGGIVDETALYDALASGKVAGAAMDVFETEPVDPQNPLLKSEGVVCTPHVGAATTEAQEQVAVAIAEQIADYLIRGIIRHAANLPSVSADLLPRLQPYLVLAEKMGAFLAQLYEGALQQVTIEYRGEVAELSAGGGTAPLTIAALRGLLNPILENNVNYVNAPVVAKERGIEVREVRSDDAGNFTSQLVLRIKTDRGTEQVAGTLYKKSEPRIVNVNRIPLEVTPSGSMLMLVNNDQPGVIGAIGTLLGDSQINIARMELGREAPHGRAISVIGIDAPIPSSLLDRLRRLPQILSVKQIRL